MAYRYAIGEKHRSSPQLHLSPLDAMSYPFSPITELESHVFAASRPSTVGNAIDVTLYHPKTGFVPMPSVTSLINIAPSRKSSLYLDPAEDLKVSRRYVDCLNFEILLYGMYRLIQGKNIEATIIHTKQPIHLHYIWS